jgi:predicted Kef-type K+ transport protein
VQESTAAIVRGAVDDVRELAQAELALVKLEVGERVASIRELLTHAVPRVAAGGALAMVGAVATMVGTALLLDVWLQAWAAWLIVGLTCSIGGAVLLLRAMQPRPSGPSLAAGAPPVALDVARATDASRSDASGSDD